MIAGKFETLAGAEVIEDPSNANISRSILFGYAVPFTHTGARLTYAPNALISLIAGVNNGWDNLKGPGGPKTAELGAAYNGSVISLTAQGYLGMERYSNAMWSAAGDSPAGHRSLIDVVATYHATPKLTLLANADGGRQTAVPLLDSAGAPLGGPLGTATWNGVAGYAAYQLTAKLSGGAAQRDVQRSWRLSNRVRPAMGRDDAHPGIRAVRAGRGSHRRTIRSLQPSGAVRPTPRREPRRANATCSRIARASRW